jgi:hypothetical protein
VIELNILFQSLLWGITGGLYLILIFTSFKFQNIVFYKNVSILNKRKINLISFLLENKLSGFTLYDLFKLDANRGFYVSKLLLIEPIL